jgi:hypothetical protein
MNPETLQDVALAVAAERSIGRVLEQIVTGLAAQPGSRKGGASRQVAEGRRRAQQRRVGL